MSGNDNTSDREAMFSTVGQLRELLEGIPSDAEVSISELPGQHDPVSMALLPSIGDRHIEPWATRNVDRGSITHVTICEVGPVNAGEAN